LKQAREIQTQFLLSDKFNTQIPHPSHESQGISEDTAQHLKSNWDLACTNLLYKQGFCQRKSIAAAITLLQCRAKKVSSLVHGAFVI
jgi:hypothetical protein